MEQRRRVLVTGSSGFIGAALKPVLAARGFRVFGAGLHGARQDRQCDLRNVAAVSQMVIDVDPDVVVHCAGVSSVTKGRPVDYYDVNVVGTENILHALAMNDKRTRFIFLSTAGVYGNHPLEMLDEGLRAEPVHHYGISKLAAERVVRLYESEMDVTIFRPFNIIGPGQDRTFLVPKLVCAFARLDPTIRLGNIHVYRDFLDVWTAAEIIADVIDRPGSFGEILNLCTGHGTSLLELITALRELTGHEPRIEQATEFTRKNEIWRLAGSPERLRGVIGADRRRPLPIKHVLRTMLEHERDGVGIPA